MFTTVHQVCRVEGGAHAGRTTVKKGNTQVTRDPGAAAGGAPAPSASQPQAQARGPRGAGEASPDAASTQSKTVHSIDSVPPAGHFFVIQQSDGGLRFVYNSTDVKKWPEPLKYVVQRYIEFAFGITDSKRVAAIIDGKGLHFQDGPPSKDLPEGRQYTITFTGDVHGTVSSWVEKTYNVRARKIRVESTVSLSDAGGGGGQQEGEDGGGADDRPGTPGADDVARDAAPGKAADPNVERARALYERLRREFPDDDVWQSTGAIYPEFLEFLAEHADEIKKLPKTKKGVGGISISTLKKMLEQFRRQQETKRGSSAGDLDGHDDGKERGGKDGTATGDERVSKDGGSEGGSIYGEAGGSKYGWHKWDPKGEIAVSPRQETYVAGAEIAVEMKWDYSVHPRAGQIVLPNHCSYVWKMKRGNKVVDIDGHSIFADDRATSLDIGKQAGEYEILVRARSNHFKTKTFETTYKIKVVSEKDFDKAKFDEAEVHGEHGAFKRDDKGALSVRDGVKPLSVDDEIHALDVTKGGVDQLAQQGRSPRPRTRRCKSS